VKFDPIDIKQGASVIIINSAGDIVTSGEIESIDVMRYGGFNITVAGKCFTISSYKTEHVVINKDDYRSMVDIASPKELMDILEKKLKFVVDKMSDDDLSKMLGLMREMDRLTESYVAAANQDSGISYASYQKMWGNHVLTEEGITKNLLLRLL
jgi:hypothetical protein